MALYALRVGKPQHLMSSTILRFMLAQLAHSISSDSSADGNLGTGAIAGIAVGVVVGVTLAIGFTFCFVRRHWQSRAQIRQGIVEEIIEKPQLHSNDYTPHREELEGSKPSPLIREIPGLNELENVPLTRQHLEMAANETAGHEISSRLLNEQGSHRLPITSLK